MQIKLRNILQGWAGYIFETPQIKSMAESRAVECAKCEHAVHGMVAVLIQDEIEDINGLKCDLCDCPLSGLLRSADSKCKIDKWQVRTK